LHSAAYGGHLEVVTWLVEQGGADVKAADKDGSTALDMAKLAGRTDVVELLTGNANDDH
jgi:ankyrin repeat protein